MRPELDEDHSSIASERLRKRGYLPSTFYIPSSFGFKHNNKFDSHFLNPLNAELNPVCYLLALLAHHFLHVSSVRVKSLTLRLLMSYIYIYIYMERLFLMFLDHTQRRSTLGMTPLDE